MELYLLEVGAQCLGFGPLDETLKAFPMKGPHAWDATHLKARVPYLNSQPDILDSRELPDFINIGHELIVSKRTKSLIEEARVERTLRIIPTSIVNRTGTLLGEYFYIWSPSEHMVIDRNRARLRYYAGSEAIAEVYEWAVMDDQIPQLDLFFSEAYRWIATERLNRLFSDHRITGCSFTHIGRTDDCRAAEL